MEAKAGLQAAQQTVQTYKAELAEAEDNALKIKRATKEAETRLSTAGDTIFKVKCAGAEQIQKRLRYNTVASAVTAWKDRAEQVKDRKAAFADLFLRIKRKAGERSQLEQRVYDLQRQLEDLQDGDRAETINLQRQLIEKTELLLQTEKKFKQLAGWVQQQKALRQDRSNPLA